MRLRSSVFEKVAATSSAQSAVSSRDGHVGHVTISATEQQDQQRNSFKKGGAERAEVGPQCADASGAALQKGGWAHCA